MTDLWPWLLLAGLGLFHGINPAMGWLFAVALGLQKRDRGAVVRAVGPIALGHALSITVVVVAFGLGLAIVRPGTLRLLSAAALIGFSLYKVGTGFRHPRWVGMRLGSKDLAVWSFLVASAHGAGLMLLPALLPLGASVEGHAHISSSFLESSALLAFGAVAIHTIAMLLATATIAVVVFDKVGISFLRKGWFNLDFVWAVALVLAAMVLLAV